MEKVVCHIESATFFLNAMDALERAYRFLNVQDRNPAGRDASVVLEFHFMPARFEVRMQTAHGRMRIRIPPTAWTQYQVPEDGAVFRFKRYSTILLLKGLGEEDSLLITWDAAATSSLRMFQPTWKLPNSRTVLLQGVPAAPPIEDMPSMFPLGTAGVLLPPDQWREMAAVGAVVPFAKTLMILPDRMVMEIVGTGSTPNMSSFVVFPLRRTTVEQNLFPSFSAFLLPPVFFAPAEINPLAGRGPPEYLTLRLYSPMWKEGEGFHAMLETGTAQGHEVAILIKAQ